MNISYKGQREIEKAKKDASKEKILEILKCSQQMDVEGIYKEISKDFQVGERNVRSAIQELEKAMKIESSKMGKKKIYSLRDADIKPTESLV